MVRIYGNWCGPGWTAGQHKDAKELTDEDRKVPAVDPFDALCKQHDIALHDAPFAAAEINARFRDEAEKLGILPGLAGKAVEWFGPGPQPVSNLPSQEDIMRLRGTTSLGNSRTKKMEMEMMALENENANQKLKRKDHPTPDTGGGKLQGIEVIPQSASLRGSAMDTNMGDSGDDGPVEARALTSQGAATNQSKETPVSSYPSLSYGLQETHTTIIPWTGYVSVCGLENTTPVQIAIRMNSIYDIIANNALQTPPDADAAYTTKGIFATPVNSADPMKRPAYGSFPSTYSGSTGEIAHWAKTWNALYQWYTVLGCEYRITIANPSERRGCDIIVGEQFDTYTDKSTATGNIMPQTNLREVMAYKNIKWHYIEGSSDYGNPKHIAVIEGTYKPGQVKRNVTNDGDVKTWTWTDASGAPDGSTNRIPNLKELLTLNFWTAPLAYGGVSKFSYGANIQIDVKYIVQYKDLKMQVRYPHTSDTTGNTSILFSNAAGDVGNPMAEY